jgi:PAS domain S-box-containing protein
MGREPDDPRERRYELILDSLHEGVFTVDMDRRITSFNRAAETITGIPRGQAIGRYCFEVFRADVCETGCMLRRTLETQIPVQDVPVRIFRADRRQIPPSRPHGPSSGRRTGRVAGAVETFRAVSEINELQKAVRRQHSLRGHRQQVSPDDEDLRPAYPCGAERAARSLIEGPAGDREGVVAPRAIHNHSPHRDGRFVAVNCGGAPRYADRVRAVRLQRRRLHRRPPGQAREIRHGAERHDLPRRDRRHLPRRAGALLRTLLQEKGLRTARFRAARENETPASSPRPTGTSKRW